MRLTYSKSDQQNISLCKWLPWCNWYFHLAKTEHLLDYSEVISVISRILMNKNNIQHDTGLYYDSFANWTKFYLIRKRLFKVYFSDNISLPSALLIGLRLHIHTYIIYIYNSRERSSALPYTCVVSYRKGSLRVTFDNGRQLYFTYIYT